MSDFEEVDEEQQRGLENVLRRYQQRGTGSSSSSDKRQETSKVNMAKARAAKIAKLCAQKEERDNTIEVSEDDDDDDDYSDSDGEEYIAPKKKAIQKMKGRGRQTASAVDDGAMARLEQMEMRYAALVAQLEKEKRQRKAPAKPRKTAVSIQIAPPAAAPKPAVTGANTQERFL